MASANTNCDDLQTWSLLPSSKVPLTMTAYLNLQPAANSRRDSSLSGRRCSKAKVHIP